MFFLVLAVKMNQFFDIGITSSLKFLLVAKAHKNLQNHIFIPCTYQTLLKIQKDAVYIFYETCSSDQQILLSKTSIKTQQTYIVSINIMSFFDFMVIITDKFSEGLNFSELETYTIHSRFKFFVGNKKCSVL